MKNMIKLSAFLLALTLLLLLPVQVNAAEAITLPDGLEEEVVTAIMQRADKLNVYKYRFTFEEWNAYFSQILDNHPELYFVKRQVSASTSNGIVNDARFQYVSDEISKAIEKVAQEIVDQCVYSWMSPAQKALALHDYLTVNCKYDLTYSHYSAYDALIGGTAVCQGYAEAYAILLGKAGIPSKVVSSAGMNHAWNLVKIDGAWYHVDTTWDDPVYNGGYDIQGLASHENFLLSDTGITQTEHYGWTSDTDCTSSTYDSGWFWDDTESAVLFFVDDYYVIREDDVGSMHVTKVYENGKEEVLYRDDNTYFNYGGYRQTTSGGGLSVWEDKLYFADLLHVYAMPVGGGEAEKVCSLSDVGGGHCILGSHVKDDTVYMTIWNLDTGAFVEKTYSIAVHEHTYDLWQIDSQPAGGYGKASMHRDCTSCGYTESATYDFTLTDVPSGKYFSKPVYWAFVNGITKGKTTTEFQRDASCTRKQIVTFLWRAAGQPEPKSMVNPFTDVKRGDQFEKAILWAYYEGITSGTGDGTTFSPENACTRKQIVTFLWRFYGQPTPVSTKIDFTDVKNDRFAPAILWAAEQGITTGTGDGSTFSPENTCTRGQIVTFLYRAIVESKQ